MACTAGPCARPQPTRLLHARHTKHMDGSCVCMPAQEAGPARCQARARGSCLLQSSCVGGRRHGSRLLWLCRRHLQPVPGRAGPAWAWGHRPQRLTPLGARAAPCSASHRFGAGAIAMATGSCTILPDAILQLRAEPPPAGAGMEAGAAVPSPFQASEGLPWGRASPWGRGTGYKADPWGISPNLLHGAETRAAPSPLPWPSPPRSCPPPQTPCTTGVASNPPTPAPALCTPACCPSCARGWVGAWAAPILRP